MSEAITPKQLAAAAAQGVAIALNARKPKSGAIKEEVFLPHRIIVCGIPAELFDVHLVADEAGQVNAGSVAQRQTEA